MKPKPPLEKEITKEIRKFLDTKHIYHWKQWQGLGSNNGVADILGIMPLTSIRPGTFLAIEVKTERGKFDKKGKQEKFLLNIKSNNGISFVARSVQDVIDSLKPYW